MGYEKVNLISPSLRLWAAKDSIKNGARQTAATIGVNHSTVRQWVSAYRAVGDKAHIFQTHDKPHCLSENSLAGFSRFTTEAKFEIIDRAMKENSTKVAYEYGIAPKTILKWKRKFNCPTLQRAVIDYPVPDWYQKNKKTRHEKYVGKTSRNGWNSTYKVFYDD